MLRPLLRSDLKIGMVAGLRLAWIDQLKEGDPHYSWKAPCEAIALGEKLALGNPRPALVHIAIVAAISQADGATVTMVEELADGNDRVDEPIDGRWNFYDPDWKDEGDRQKVVDWCVERLHTPYNYGGLVFIGLSRILHIPQLAPAQTSDWECSTEIACARAALGYNDWPGLEPQQVAPSDYAPSRWKQIGDAGLYVAA